MSWTDNGAVVPGTDPRDIEEQNGFDDGFDVLQCRVDLAEKTQSRDDGPLARRTLYGRQLRQWLRARPEHLRQLSAPPVAKGQAQRPAPWIRPGRRPGSGTATGIAFLP
jgi:hypothetical protein